MILAANLGPGPRQNLGRLLRQHLMSLNGDPIRPREDHFAGRLSVEKFLPPAPELDPVEPLGSWLKYRRLCNFAPEKVLQLND